MSFPFYLPAEVSLHNKPDDCWLTCLANVYDLSEYVRRNAASPISKQLLAYAGKDVTFWFDVPRGYDPRKRRGIAGNGAVRLRRYVDPGTGLHRILLPYENPLPERAKSKLVPISAQGSCGCGCVCATGRLPPISNDLEDHSLDAQLTGNCWSELELIFNGTKYQKGWLTKKSRPCRISNVLTGQQVCEEDNIKRIQERALIFNRHGASYTWKFEGKPLCMYRTLTENGIPDERDRYLACGLPDDYTTYIPNLLCYYNDDLTEL